MKRISNYKVMVNALLMAMLTATPDMNAQTVALWSFDEPVGLYPSGVISDLSENDYPLTMGQGGRIVEGKFGNALTTAEPVKMDYPEGDVNFGLQYLPVPQGRTQEPMTWMNARFAALMTNGEKHLRNQVGYPHPTQTRINLGEFDWTVEFWYKPNPKSGSGENTKSGTNPKSGTDPKSGTVSKSGDATDSENYGVVFELGTGPRAENHIITRLALNSDQKGFTLTNGSSGNSVTKPSDNSVSGSSGNSVTIPSDIPVDEWSHLAFVYSARKKQIRHYVNGKSQGKPVRIKMQSLPEGEEDYMSIGRDGHWNQALQGIIDELRFSDRAIYSTDFSVPYSFARTQSTSTGSGIGSRQEEIMPLFFAGDVTKPLDAVTEPIDLGSRKHLFIDDAMISQIANCEFAVNPPRLDKVVVENIQGTFRKHVSIVEDEDGLIRMYYGGPDDCLEVRTSIDGVNFTEPDLGRGEYQGKKNVVLRDPSAMGNVFIDPKAPPKERWRFISDYNRRGIYLFSSEDGFNFTRMPTAILPFRSGSQSNSFYDNQQDKYISYHRCDFTSTKAGATRRTFILTEADIIDRAWPFTPATMQDYKALEGKVNMRSPVPWYLDNGPLTPGGFSIEYPTIFQNISNFDPPETDIYVPKAIKYPWAQDVYLAFPLIYFHYEDYAEPLRMILFSPERERGSGPIETQLSVSRDAVNWKRYPRPAYTGIGMHAGADIKQAYLAHGMVKRGDEIWQYYFGETRYHSSWEREGYKREVYRLIQRVDGFVSIDAPYGKEGSLTTKPFRFKGNRLVLNVDTDAAGFVQVGFLDKNGQPIEGFTLDECIYINGDFTDARVEWLQNAGELAGIDIEDEEDYVKFAAKVKTSLDVSSLEGKIVQLVFRMRGSKLYAMEFIKE